MTQELRSNKDIETAAIEYALAHEKRAGREARDARHVPSSKADIVSRWPGGPEFDIEIKAYGASARTGELWLEPNQVDAALANPETFRLYVIENVRQGDKEKFRLLDIHGPRLAELLRGRKEHRYLAVPLRAADYDRIVREAAEDAAAEQYWPHTEAALRLLEAVRILHQRGFQQFRVWCGIAPSGMYWRALVIPAAGQRAKDAVVAAEAEEMQKVSDSPGATALGSAQCSIGGRLDGLEIAGHALTPWTDPSELADAILRLFPGITPVPAPMYAGWFSGLLGLARELRAMPRAYDLSSSAMWVIGQGHDTAAQSDDQAPEHQAMSGAYGVGSGAAGWNFGLGHEGVAYPEEPVQG